MKLIALDTTATITKRFPYWAVKSMDGKVKIMDDYGVNKWMLKSHFMEVQ